MTEYLPLIMKSKLFEDFTESECLAIYSLFQPDFKEYKKNQVIVNEGDRINSIGIVLKGRFISTKLDYNGSTHLMEVLRPPMLLGLEVVTTPTRVSPLTITSSEESSIMAFPYEKLLTNTALESKHKIKMLNNIIHLLANENLKKMYKIEVLSTRSLRDRIMMYLDLMEKKTGKTSFDIDMNREQFAQYLCVNRSALSHELSEMEKEGLIIFNKNHFELIKN